MSFVSILQDAESTEQGFNVAIPEGWTQGRTGYGGLTSALCLAAAQSEAGDRPLRSAMIAFVGPSAGLARVTAHTLRSGRNATTVAASLETDMGAGVNTLFTFSGNRDSQVSQPGPPAPVNAPSPDAEPLAFREGAPAFTQQLEFIWACDALPFSGSQSSRILSWVRHKDAEAWDHPQGLVCLADALPPAIAVSINGFAPLSSMTWMIDFFEDNPSTDNGWWLLESSVDFAQGGHSTQDMTIWNTKGACVAKGRQMVTYFA